jgi:antitoxin HicB
MSEKVKYPALFDPAVEGGFIVTFRDIPEAITQGETEIEAMEMAQDALRTALEFYDEDGRVYPDSSDLRPGEQWVEIEIY